MFVLFSFNNGALYCLQRRVDIMESLAEQDSGQSSGVQHAGLLDSSTDEPRTVLRVVIENMLYAVTLDMLQQVC